MMPDVLLATHAKMFCLFLANAVSERFFWYSLLKGKVLLFKDLIKRRVLVNQTFEPATFFGTRKHFLLLKFFGSRCELHNDPRLVNMF